jgi:histidinol-phosphate aminotransferase
MAPKFVRPVIAAMAGYTPGEQPRAGDRVVKINTNENPFPPSPRVMAAIAGIEPEWLRRYPDPNADAFRAAAAAVHQVDPDWLIAGNGSDDILAVAMNTFLSCGDSVVCPEPTYSLYPVLAELQGVRHLATAWREGWKLPTDDLIAAGGQAIFLANPNAPSGTVVAPADIEDLLKRFSGLVLVDEAYADFAEDNCLGLVKKYENLLLVRTLSKGYSLAGLRFGYGIAQPQVIREMNKAKDSYPCDAISIVAATAAISDQAYARQTWQHVRGERARLAEELVALGYEVLPSQANFLLATCPRGNARQIYQGLKQQGILVRYFDKPGLTDKLRISIGTSQENNALLGGLKALAAS